MKRSTMRSSYASPRRNSYGRIANNGGAIFRGLMGPLDAYGSIGVKNMYVSR